MNRPMPGCKLVNMTRHRILLTSVLMICVSLLQSTELFGQYYRLFDKDRTMTFTRRAVDETDSLYYFMKTTGFDVAGEDTTFYFNKQLRTIGDPDCAFQTLDTIDMGHKALVQNDTDITYVFFNKNNDSIFIHTQIEVGDVWHVYDWPDGTYIKATVVNKLERTILPDVLDTLMRIQLNVVTAAGVTLTDVFPNGTKFDITKHYGIIEFFDFYNFPEPGDSLPLLLRGLSNPDMNIVDVDAQTAFNYETGYEFHYREEQAPDMATGADLRISAWKYFVMARTDLPNGVSYTMQRIQFDTLYTGGMPSSNVIWDTVTVEYLYDDYAFLDTLELTVLQNTLHGYADWIKADTLYKGFAHKYVYDWFNYDAGTACLSNPDDINMPEQLYGEGLGLIHYLDSTDASNYYKWDMTYFHIGLKEWGTPYDFSALDMNIGSLAQAETLHLFPNPASAQIHVTVPAYGDLQYTIFNMQGVALRAQALPTGTGIAVIDIASLPAGYYTMRITGNTGLAIGTFIKY